MIDKIESFTNNTSYEDFSKDVNLIDATIMRLQVIGENMSNIPYSLRKQHKSIRWKTFLNMRNFFSHKYSAINHELLWQIVKNRIPVLKEEITKIMQTI
ncbi:DUF86 domain-containing protein [Candidatus Pacearchaeota archaeon]|nr:DUF86 domain-containing protein [Candidatus Pacearchaeota archaeon]